MAKNTVDNGLWGVKGDLKTNLEGVTIPVWMESPTGKSVLDFVESKRKEAIESGEDVSFVLQVDKDEAPDNISERMDDWAEENGEPNAWGVAATFTPNGVIKQGDLELFADA